MLFYDTGGATLWLLPNVFNGTIHVVTTPWLPLLGPGQKDLNREL
jgi:hypothetical protein